MARTVLSGLIQASNPLNDETKSVAEIQAAMFEKHLPMIHDAGKQGVQILCLQEIFNGPYFCPGQDKRWYDAAEPVPGPTVEKLRPIAASAYRISKADERRNRFFQREMTTDSRSNALADQHDRPF